MTLIQLLVSINLFSFSYLRFTVFCHAELTTLLVIDNENILEINLFMMFLVKLGVLSFPVDTMFMYVAFMII